MRGRGSFLACESVNGTVFVQPEEVREQVEEEGGQEVEPAVTKKWTRCSAKTFP